MAEARMVPGAEAGPLLAAEGRRLAELTADGVVAAAWVRADRDGAYLLVEAVDEADAADQLTTLPFVAEGLMTFTLVRIVAAQPAARPDGPAR